MALRRELAWRGVNLDRVFHATTELQAVRDEVYGPLAGKEIRVDATIFEKRKALPRLYEEARFYQMVWWLHFKMRLITVFRGVLPPGPQPRSIRTPMRLSIEWYAPGGVSSKTILIAFRSEGACAGLIGTPLIGAAGAAPILSMIRLIASS